MDLIEQAKQAINECFYMNIASITENGKPWNTPVYFFFDNDYNFYWTSPKDSVHSQNIRQNPNIFLTIYQPDEKGVGVYIEANAIELDSEEEITPLLDLMSRNKDKKERDFKDYLNNSPLRIYKAVPNEVSVSTPETAEKYNGLWVDKRMPIKLS